MRAVLERLAFAVLLAALPVSAALFSVWVHHDKVELGYSLAEANRQRQALRRELQQLEVELAAERSPEQLMRRAVDLGLVAPRPEQVLGGSPRPQGDAQ